MMKKEKIDWFVKALLLTIALIFVFLMVYSPHFDYKFPFHIDEWHHLTMAKDMKQKGIGFFTSYFNPVESGFQLILAFIDMFLPLVLVYRFLPAINAVVISIVLFYFLNKKYNFWAGLISVIFLASLRSHTNIVGLWFYTPVIGAIVFSYLTLFTLEEAVCKNNPKKFYLAALFLFILAFIHQSSFLVIFLTVLIYLAFNYKFVKENYKYFSPFLILLIPAFIVIKRIPSLGAFVWGRGDITTDYNILIIYGILLTVLALLGYYSSYKDKKLLPFRIYILIPVLNLILFNFTEFTIFSAYYRYIYHFMIAAVPLSTVGFFKLLMIFNARLKKLKKALKLNIAAVYILKYLVIGIICIVCFIIIFQGYSDLSFKTKLTKYIDDHDYEAMIFLKDYGEPSKAIRLHPTQAEVISEKNVSIFMPAISEKASIFTDPLAASTKEKEAVAKFFNGDCSDKREIAYSSYYGNLKYAYSYEELGCDFLEAIYNKEGVYIYKIIKN